MKPYRFPLSGLLLSLLLLAPVHLRAQDDDDEYKEPPTNRAWLTVAVDKRGAARVSLRFPVPASDEELLKRTLVKSFSFPVQLTEVDYDDEESDEQTTKESPTRHWTMITGGSARAFTHQGLTSSCRINLHSLLPVLQSNNIEHLELVASFENASADTPVNGAQRMTLGNTHLDMYQADIDVRAPSLQVIDFTMGYSTVDVLKKTVPLFAFLFLPLLWTRRSARKFSDRPEELWGRHLRFISRLLKVIWIVWLPIYSLSGLDGVISFALGNDQRDIADLVNLSLYFVPPILAMLLCHFASRKVYELVPTIEFSPSDVVRSAIASTTFRLAPLFLIILAINTFRTNPRQAALYAVIGYVGWLVMGRFVDKGWKPADALAPGALRDRIFELANKAGVVLTEVYLLPENRSQLANAYAASNDSVAVTNSVLKHLSRREVDAVMAHEIGHLKARHPHMAKTRTLLIIIVANVVGSVVAWMTDLRHSAALVFSGALAASTLAVFFISRRNEREADDIGITITEDPEAFISGTSKLTRLGLAPMHQSVWGESLDSHPGTMRRNQEIAHAHGISAERLQELVADSTTPPDDKYPANETEEDRYWVFSWYFKKQYHLRVGLVSLGVMLLTPAPFALLFTANDGLIRLPIFLAAAIGCFALLQLVRNKTRYWGQASHARKLRVQLEKRGLAEIARSGPIVGLAPAAESRIYDGYLFWDVGVLWLTDEKLYYVGELTQFAIERDRVQNVYTQDAQPEWLPEENLFLQWQKDGQDEKETLHFVAVGERSVRQARQAIDSLRERLECWRNQSLELTPVVGLESVAGPAFSEITSVPTRTKFHAPSVVAAAVQLACYAALVGFALRLPVLGMCFMAGVLFVGTFLDEVPKSFRRYKSAVDQFDPANYQRGSWADSNAARS